jgi:hypothetical protein
VGWRLLESVHAERKVRLLGLSASNLDAPQLGLFEQPGAPADRLRDSVDKRFGTGTLTRASLIRERSESGAPEPDTLRDRRGSRRLRR